MPVEARLGLCCGAVNTRALESCGCNVKGVSSHRRQAPLTHTHTHTLTHTPQRRNRPQHSDNCSPQSTMSHTRTTTAKALDACPIRQSVAADGTLVLEVGLRPQEVQDVFCEARRTLTSEPQLTLLTKPLVQKWYTGDTALVMRVISEDEEAIAELPPGAITIPLTNRRVGVVYCSSFQALGSSFARYVPELTATPSGALTFPLTVPFAASIDGVECHVERLVVPDQGIKRCEQCATHLASSHAPQCSMCRSACYCNAACQHRHWHREHRTQCRSWKAIREHATFERCGAARHEFQAFATTLMSAKLSGGAEAMMQEALSNATFDSDRSRAVAAAMTVTYLVHYGMTPVRDWWQAVFELSPFGVANPDGSAPGMQPAWYGYASVALFGRDYPQHLGNRLVEILFTHERSKTLLCQLAQILIDIEPEPYRTIDSVLRNPPSGPQVQFRNAPDTQ